MFCVVQVAKAMEYLASKFILHSDLAARNVLLSTLGQGAGAPLVAKVGDFGLSRPFYQRSYVKTLDGVGLPFQWLAPEFFKSGEFYLSSDVWSYGVLFWEMFSLGQCPYGDNVTYENVKARLLLEGKYLECPTDPILGSPSNDWFTEKVLFNLKRITHCTMPHNFF